VKIFGVIHGVVILGMQYEGTGLEGLTGHCHGGHASTNDAVSLEHVDLSNWGLGRVVGGGVLAEEMRHGSAVDAPIDYADRAGECG
ncbi:Hypothetical predicted protein, partial [Olea europaea subsp. europaea]